MTMRMYELNDLLYLMARLRDPETGCPWDLKQSYASIVPHTLEEAYEVAHAIENGDKAELKDELGDLLFQVIFYAQLGKEDGAFEFADVVDNVVRKLIRRHPHVFPDQNLRAAFPPGVEFSEEQVKEQWEKIKAEERQLKDKQSGLDDLPEGGGMREFSAGKHSIFKDIPTNMPALNRAEKLQKRAAQVGFDWPDLPPVMAKLEEELAELRVEIEHFKKQDLRSQEAHARLTDELGDLFFCCVNLARFLKVNPDEAVRSTNMKFQTRFNYLETWLVSEGKSFEDLTLAEMDVLWERAKQENR